MAKSPRITGPIPGMSLTQTPKNAPWERPPEITDPEKAIEYHLTRLSNPDTMEQGLFILEERRATLVELVEGLMRAATYQGIHNVDVGLIVAPVVHEFIKQTASAAGVDYDEGLEDMSKAKQEAQARVMARAKKLLKESKVDLPDVTRESVMEQGQMTQEEPMSAPMEEPMVEEEMPQKRGLMSRGGM